MRPDRPFLLLLSPAELLDAPEERDWHAGALRAALRDICGIAHPQLPARDGHTDWTLLDEALTRAGLSGCMTEATFTALARSAADHYAGLCPPDLDRFLRPGAAATCAELAGGGQALIVPCTGALRPIALTLFDRAGIALPLNVTRGAFASFGATRPDLILQARRNAASRAFPWPAERTVLVSRAADSLTAARSAGVRAVSVGARLTPADAHVTVLDRLPELLASWR